jgi:exodeoxyribonuclease VII small subunit
MNKDKISLAEALEELEKIVEALNKNDIDVEKGLEEFKKGVELVEFCRAELKTAENQFVELKARLDKTAVDEDADAA